MTLHHKIRSFVDFVGGDNDTVSSSVIPTDEAAGDLKPVPSSSSSSCFACGVCAGSIGPLNVAAILTSDVKKIRLKVSTTKPALHVYSGKCAFQLIKPALRLHGCSGQWAFRLIKLVLYVYSGQCVFRLINYRAKVRFRKEISRKPKAPRGRSLFRLARSWIVPNHPPLCRSSLKQKQSAIGNGSISHESRRCPLGSGRELISHFADLVDGPVNECP